MKKLGYILLALLPTLLVGWAPHGAVVPPIPAVVAVQSLVSNLAFDEEWRTSCSLGCNFNALYPNWTTYFYFGVPGQQSSREYGGVSNVMVDTTFIADAQGPQVDVNGLNIVGYKFSPSDATLLGRPYGSQVVTTQHSFTTTYGYFEIKARFPQQQSDDSFTSGTWPAFWLLPVANTGSGPTGNSGQLAEVDILEEYGGTFFIPPVGPTIDRVGKPIFTLHYGTNGTPLKVTNCTANTLTCSTQTAVTPGFHVYGFLWTATTLTVYVDQVVTYTGATPIESNPGDMDDPHYILMSMDIGGTSGDPTLGDCETSTCRYEINYVRVWNLK